MSLISLILPNIQTLLLMPILWVMAFCMSYPQMHYKELITMSVNQFVATEAVIPFSDWIGKGKGLKTNLNFHLRLLQCLGQQ